MTELPALPAVPAANAVHAIVAIATGSAEAGVKGTAFQAALIALAPEPTTTVPPVAVPTVMPTPPPALVIPIIMSGKLPVTGTKLPVIVPAATSARSEFASQPRNKLNDYPKSGIPVDAAAVVTLPAATPQPIINPLLHLLAAPPALALPLAVAQASEATAAVADPPGPPVPATTVMMPSAAGAIAAALAPVTMHAVRVGGALSGDDTLPATAIETRGASSSGGAALAFAPDAAGVAIIPALTVSAPVQPAQDFATLVDRLVDARTIARSEVAPQIVTAAVMHREFGTVSLDFVADPAGLSVAMTSSDPGFARSAQTALAAIPQPGAASQSSLSSQGDAPQNSMAGNTGQMRANIGGGNATPSQPQPQSQPRIDPRAASRATGRRTAAGTVPVQATGIFA